MIVYELKPNQELKKCEKCGHYIGFGQNYGVSFVICDRPGWDDCEFKPIEGEARS